MRLSFRLLLLLLPFLLWSGNAAAQERAIVDASAPLETAITVYRDPNRGPYDQLNRDWPQGFAMISETREVSLPPGQSTIRFTGVAEGMVAVSAIVTGLPGGTIEKNRNADLLSPAALIDGTLGNRVRITRTNPGTGEEESESAIIRTRADGGLVLQTDDGFEAVRCSGLPERLSFDRVPDELSPEPVFTLDTQDRTGGTYRVVLTYLAWGFDWQANYVATLHEGGDSDDVRLHLLSWLTILNDNNQSFEDADLMAVAGTLSVVSDFQGLSDPPRARPLQLTCYPLGSTAAGSPIGWPYDDLALRQSGAPPPPPPPPPPAPMMVMESADAIVLTGSRVMTAEEEALGDLKLYRIPGDITVAAQSLKQVAFLDREEVKGRFLYTAFCDPFSPQPEAIPAQMLYATVNDEEHGLGVALPTGSIAFFEMTRFGELLVGEQTLRDHASGQDVEIELGQTTQVFARCEWPDVTDRVDLSRWNRLRMTLTNANPAPVTIRLDLGSPAQADLRGIETRLKNGRSVAEIGVPGNGTREVEWQARQAGVD